MSSRVLGISVEVGEEGLPPAGEGEGRRRERGMGREVGRKPWEREERESERGEREREEKGGLGRGEGGVVVGEREIIKIGRAHV